MIIPLVYCWSFIKNDSVLADKGAKNWARFSLWMLEKLCNIKYEIRGLENLPSKNGFVVACKHQSMWETIVFHLVFNRPVYSWKKELLKIPFYGWFLNAMSGITIDRKGGSKALKNLLAQSKKYVDKGQNIILFPQGTRTPVNASIQDYPYQPGIVAIYNHLQVTVVPAALNSGVHWNKKGSKKPGTIILEFLPAIEPGLEKKEFLQRLENAIETKSEQLL
ncbi:MAG: 1-acyl-sn-glycerol-3-phosphate acyltransferase [Rickettsiaceae bacterium]|jgi:1-acyl-sn-glycerol-3-phosphate acyltransferase|nr:1-acyl-sn-glycerol-3-phosphate acyltransferase [Rickettsiaceae bacterium]